MSGHPLQDYVKKFDNFTLSSDMIIQDDEIQVDSEDDEMRMEVGDIINENSLEDGQPFTCGGIITEVNMKRTKTGKSMCYVKLEDLKGIMELTFFSTAVAKYRSILEEGNLVTIKGRINIRPGMPLSVVGEAVFLWQDEEEKARAEGREKLYLKYDTKNPDLNSKVKNSLETYPGETQVVVRCSSSGKAFTYPHNVKINNHLINELSGIIGDENIILK